MKIVAFSGSNSQNSINLQLVNFCLTYFAHESIEVLDLNDYEMPLFSVDREKLGFPPQTLSFIETLSTADALIISVAEHNSNITVALKNILDWCSRANQHFLKDKPVLLLSTSPGGYGGGNAMQKAQVIFPKLGASIITYFSLPSFHVNFKDGQIVNPELKVEMEQHIAAFQQKTQQLFKL